MRLARIAAILAFTLSLTARAERIDFVLDIDDVLVDTVSAEGAELDPGAGLVAFNERVYRIRPGAPEMIDSLLAVPDAKVSFFSSGEAERNVAVLKALKLADGRSAYDAAYVVLSRGDVTATTERLARSFHLKDYNPEVNSLTPGFRNDFKKDLLKVPGLNLERATLIDDKPHNAARGQERNALRIRTSGRPTLVGLGLPENDLAHARGLIAQALETSEAAHTAFAAELARLQASKTNERAVFDRGVAAITKTAPGFTARLCHKTLEGFFLPR